jgi:hypothetical protein
MKMPEFSVYPGTRVPVEYAAQVCHFTLQGHAAMADFTDKKFTGHGLLGNTFIRFLVWQCGNSSLAVLEKRVGAVEKSLKNLNTRAEDEVAASKKRAAKLTSPPPAG